MSGPVHRQPWFWAILAAVVALFIFTMAIVASNRGDAPDSTTVVQAPSPPDSPEIVPFPPPGAPATPPPAEPTQPVEPSPPAAPAEPTQPASPPVVRERTIIIEREDGTREEGERAGEGAVTRHPSTTGKTGEPTPSERKSPKPAETAPAAPSQKEFRSTGMPMELRFEDRTWRAAEERTIADTTAELRTIGNAEDGAEVYVRKNAKEPYDRILVPLLDEEGKFVEYRRVSPP